MYIYILGVTQLKKLNNRLVGFYMNKMLELSARAICFSVLGISILLISYRYWWWKQESFDLETGTEVLEAHDFCKLLDGKDDVFAFDISDDIMHCESERTRYR